MSLPIITGIYPTLVGVQGGTNISIYGSNLSQVLSVFFGINSTDFTIDSDHLITTDSLPGIGTIQITVTNNIGNSLSTISSQLSYVDKPTLTSMSPISGPSHGGTRVDFMGSNFTGTSEVSFGGQLSQNFVVVSDTLITAITPPGIGIVDAIIINVAGFNSLSSFNYIIPPLISSISPQQGPIRGGNTVTLSGISLLTTTNVYCGNNPAIFVINNDNQIIITMPAGNGMINIYLTNSVAKTNTITYTYIGVPIISYLNPDSGSTMGNNNCTITGTDLTYTNNVQFGNQSTSTFYIISDQQVIVNVPTQNSGSVSVNLLTIGGESNQLSYTYINSPSI